MFGAGKKGSSLSGNHCLSSSHEGHKKDSKIQNKIVYFGRLLYLL